MGEFRDGFIAIARKADAAIVPITLHNADRVWPAVRGLACRSGDARR